MKRQIKGIRNNSILTFAQVALLEEFVKSDLNDAFRLTGIEKLPLRISVKREDIEKFFKTHIKGTITNETP